MVDAYSSYAPYLVVNVNGEIDIDFFDSYTDSHPIGPRLDGLEAEERDAIEEQTSALLDEVLGTGSTPDKLRRLADYIEAFPNQAKEGTIQLLRELST